MSPAFRLRAERGPNVGQVFSLDDSTTLGRQAGNEITLADPQLSRRHAHFASGLGGLTVTDLGAANGIHVNGQRIVGTILLQPGDLVTVGGNEFRVELAGAPTFAPAPGPPFTPLAPAPGQQPPLVPPPAAARRKPPLPLLAAVGVALLLVCFCAATAVAFLALRSDDAPAATAPPAGTAASGATTRARPGYVSGQILTADGRPITVAGAVVKVSVTGVSTAGERVAYQPRTDAQGRYEQQVAAGSYGATATVTVPYNGKQFTIALDPVDGDPARTEDAAKGVVKDFRWRISGPIAGRAASTTNLVSYYGLSIRLQDPALVASDPISLRGNYPQGRLRVTFTPRGPLIDGSTGQPITREIATTDLSRDGGILADLPLGAYTVSAILVDQGGGTRPLRLGDSNLSGTTFATEYQLTPEPAALFDNGITTGLDLYVRE